ncbi:small nuclear ribonuceloprotein [Vairimorpha necatrix]|uniref:Small nuclear ribonuceloprotein n=1 Tax=Vairimorpha necatrix TaxID=6039 RepID=A0AAX4JAM6_9MICR
MFSLYLYNLNYKIKAKWLKYELIKLISRYVKSYKIRISRKMPGQAFVDFENKKDMKKLKNILEDLLFLNRPIKITI